MGAPLTDHLTVGLGEPVLPHVNTMVSPLLVDMLRGGVMILTSAAGENNIGRGNGNAMLDCCMKLTRFSGHHLIPCQFRLLVRPQLQNQKPCYPKET